MSSHCCKPSMFQCTAGYSNSYCMTLRATLVSGGCQLASQGPEYVVMLLSCQQASSECNFKALHPIVLKIMLHPVGLMVTTAPTASASLLESLRLFCRTSDDSTDAFAELIDATAIQTRQLMPALGLCCLCYMYRACDKIQDTAARILTAALQAILQAPVHFVKNTLGLLNALWVRHQ